MLQTKHCSCDKGEEQGIIATDYAAIMEPQVGMWPKLKK
jgi:hypothetical protein